MIRFSYHVLDADKAKALNDKKDEPSLIDPQAGVRLVVPALEQVGQLRKVRRLRRACPTGWLSRTAAGT